MSLVQMGKGVPLKFATETKSGTRHVKMHTDMHFKRLAECCRLYKNKLHLENYALGLLKTFFHHCTVALIAQFSCSHLLVSTHGTGVSGPGLPLKRT